VSFAGRRVLVTGASRGIGRAIAESLAARDASLVLVARDAALLAEVERALAGGPHAVLALDVSDEDAWHSARAGEILEGPLHGIVTAAGVLGPIGQPGSWSVADFRATLEVNVVGTLLAVLAGLEHLVAGAAVVMFSGGGATAPLARYDAYAASKAAVVRLSENLAAELADRGLRVNAIAPGFVATTIHDDTLRAGPERAGADYHERTLRGLREGGDPLGRAVELTCYLLSEASAGITGRLLSAQWDPWGDAAFQERLRADPDLATLRRIDDQHFGSLVSGSR
jgi:3-oxoacyl-[acyl-carrier protein] reductase